MIEEEVRGCHANLTSLMNQQRTKCGNGLICRTTKKGTALEGGEGEEKSRESTETAEVGTRRDSAKRDSGRDDEGKVELGAGLHTAAPE